MQRPEQERNKGDEADRIGQRMVGGCPDDIPDFMRHGGLVYQVSLLFYFVHCLSRCFRHDENR